MPSVPGKIYKSGNTGIIVLSRQIPEKARVFVWFLPFRKAQSRTY